MKKLSLLTLYLQGAVVFLALLSLSLSALIVWDVVRRLNSAYSVLQYFEWFIIAAFAPFLYALAQLFLLLRNVSVGNAFSEISITRLKCIQMASLVVASLFILGLPAVFHAADLEDAPGMVLIWCIIIGIPVAAAAFAALLRLLWQDKSQYQ